MDELTEEDLKKTVTYEIWNNFQLSGYDSLSTIITEVPHHRGQLCVYLRLLGIKPPSIYDFS
ncbi:MAG: DinB family protein, partial [Promethearchaeota archaeon]